MGASASGRSGSERDDVRRGLLLGAALAGLWAGPAPAVEGQKLSVTIYNQDIALVQDIRSLEIGAGRQRLEFRDVSGRIRPETVSLSAADVGIVEQNFDFDLLTPSKLMEKAVGRQVQIVRTNPGNGQTVTETATVLSANEGVVLRIGDRIEVLRADGVPTRVIFDRIPENLRAQPTLSVTVQSARAGRRDAALSYLTHGLAWKADYVALFDEKAGRLDLQGWVTLTNTSGVDYRDAEVQLVAGDVALDGGGGRSWRPPPPPRPAPIRGVAGAGVEAGDQAQVADYYLYPLAERTTIAENQTKQVSFLDVKGAVARKAYTWRTSGFASADNPSNADVSLDFSNARGAGLGAQLPAGIVRVYMRDAAGDPKFIGENRIDHVPQGSDISVKTGEAFDVTVQPTLVSQERVGRHGARYAMSYLVRNARSEPATVILRQGGLWRDAEVKNASIAPRKVTGEEATFEVPVPANGETTLTFTVEMGR